MATGKPAVVTALKKKDSKSKPRSHPPYLEMISEAITTLKDRSGSSQQAIQKFIENKYNDLPVNFRKLLLTSLKKFVADDKLVKVKASYKLSSLRSPATKLPAKKLKKSAAPVKSKANSVAAKVKAPAAKKTAEKAKKSAPAKKSAAPAKSKAKSVAAKAKAPAAKETAEKMKVGAKRKAAEKKPVTKVAKTTTRSTPAKKAVVEKKAAVKTSSRSTPAKKAVVAKKTAAKTPAKKEVAAARKAPARGSSSKATRTSARKGKGNK